MNVHMEDNMEMSYEIRHIPHIKISLSKSSFNFDDDDEEDSDILSVEYLKMYN